MRRSSVWLVLVLIALLRVPLAFAQTAATGFSLEGRVLDSTRAPVAGALVTLIPEGQTSGPGVTTDQRGQFSLTLTPGPYTLTVVASGFLEQSQRVNAVSQGSGSREVVLSVAGVRKRSR